MLKLQANPTFRAKVGIPIPGEEKPATVTIVFKHMTAAEFDSFKVGETETNVDTLMRICEGWDDIDGEFSRENMAKLCDIYHGASFAIASAYAKELSKGRTGN